MLLLLGAAAAAVAAAAAAAAAADRRLLHCILYAIGLVYAHALSAWVLTVRVLPNVVEASTLHCDLRTAVEGVVRAPVRHTVGTVWAVAIGAYGIRR